MFSVVHRLLDQDDCSVLQTTRARLYWLPNADADVREDNHRAEAYGYADRRGVRDGLQVQKMSDITVLTVGRLDGLVITPLWANGKITRLEFTVKDMPGMFTSMEFAAACELRDALTHILQLKFTPICEP